MLVLGIAYKKDVDDMRESPAVELMRLLQEKGALVDYSDRYIPVFPRLRKYYFDLASVDPPPDKVTAYDALLLATDHSSFDYSMLQKCARLIVDTRGVYVEAFDNVVKA